MTKFYQKRIFILLGLTLGFFSSCNCHRDPSKDSHPTKRGPSTLKNGTNETVPPTKTTTASPSSASSNPVEPVEPVEEGSSPNNLPEKPDKEDTPIDSSTAETREDRFAATLKRLDDKVKKAKEERLKAEVRLAELQKEAAEREKEKIDRVKTMLEYKISINDIMKFTKFNREEIKKIGIDVGIDIDKDYI